MDDADESLQKRHHVDYTVCITYTVLYLVCTGTVGVFLGGFSAAVLLGRSVGVASCKCQIHQESRAVAERLLAAVDPANLYPIVKPTVCSFHYTVYAD